MRRHFLRQSQVKLGATALAPLVGSGLRAGGADPHAGPRWGGRPAHPRKAVYDLQATILHLLGLDHLARGGPSGARRWSVAGGRCQSASGTAPIRLLVGMSLMALAGGALAAAMVTSSPVWLVGTLASFLAFLSFLSRSERLRSSREERRRLLWLLGLAIAGIVGAGVKWAYDSLTLAETPLEGVERYLRRVAARWYASAEAADQALAALLRQFAGHVEDVHSGGGVDLLLGLNEGADATVEPRLYVDEAGGFAQLVGMVKEGSGHERGLVERVLEAQLVRELSPLGSLGEQPDRLQSLALVRRLFKNALRGRAAITSEELKQDDQLREIIKRYLAMLAHWKGAGWVQAIDHLASHGVTAQALRDLAGRARLGERIGAAETLARMAEMMEELTRVPAGEDEQRLRRAALSSIQSMLQRGWTDLEMELFRVFRFGMAVEGAEGRVADWVLEELPGERLPYLNTREYYAPTPKELRKDFGDLLNAGATGPEDVGNAVKPAF